MNKSDLKNGMIVTLRRGVTRIVIGIYLFDEQGDATGTLNCYNNDLTYINNCNSEDIMKIEYGGKVIWERGIEWKNVPFGTKVRAWWKGDEKTKQVGRFLAYDDDDTELPFLVFIEHIPDTNWFDYCEIIEEEEDE